MKEVRNILITGGNRGIGKAIVEKLLHANHRVTFSCRDAHQGQKVVQEMQDKTSNQKVEFVEGRLSTIASSYELVDRIRKLDQPFDCLINNAGVWMMSKVLNEDGLEMSFMVNYLAPYILCKELLPDLQRSGPSRIVNVNAGLYVKGKLDMERTPFGSDFHAIKTYANSKLCNVVASIHMANRIEGTNVTLNCVHPGVIRTGLGDSSRLISKLVNVIKLLWKKPPYGAIAPAWLATSEDVAGINGKYFNERKIMGYDDHVLDGSHQANLIEWTKNFLKNRKVS